MFTPLTEHTGLKGCLIPMLDALGWRGETGHIYEALPHIKEELDISDFLNVMANLKYSSRSTETNIFNVDERTLPCLFVTSDNTYVLVKSGGDSFFAYDSDKGGYRELVRESMRGMAFFFSRSDEDSESLHAPQKEWFKKVTARFQRPFRLSIFLSFILSLLAIAIPMFVMVIYDQIPFLTNNTTLIYILTGVAVFIVSDFGLRLVRSGLMSFVGARMGNIVGNEVFRRILYLPPSYTESASIGAQASRIKDFDSVREFFSGKAMTSLIDIPFTAILLAVMAYMGGTVAFVPITAMVLFVLLAVYYMPVVKRANENIAKAQAAKQELVMETLTKMRAIRYTGSPTMWEAKFRPLSAETCAYIYRATQISSQITTLTNLLIMGSGVATIGVGVHNVFRGSMTMGALVASILLVWRILAPLRSAFVVLLQVDKIRKSVQQVDRLMGIDIEERSDAMLQEARQMRGDISFSQVSIRYMSEAHPALLGVSFDIKHGETVAITGHDGAGKSTVLKLLLGMYRAQAGRITVDNMLVRQFAPLVLRRGIGYAPQEPQFFYGTISQNIRMAEPATVQQNIEEICKIAGIHDEIMKLEYGYETRVGDYLLKQLPTEFLTRLNIARALIRPTSIYFFDEAFDKISNSNDGLDQLIDDFHGKKTLLYTTSNSRFLKKADKIIWLEKGRLKMFGPADEVIKKLPEEFNC
ncbi:MAG: peptidase domain-containing ABC transporter [Desulfovibrio sp.]